MSSQSLRRHSPWRALVGGLLLLAACRSPVKPIFEREPIGTIYDTSMEAEIREGTAHALVMSAYGDYVDTLAEAVAVTRWSDSGSDWELFAATNRGWFESPGDPQAANRVLDEVQYGRCVVSLPKPHGYDVKTASDRKGAKLTSATNSAPSDQAEVFSTVESRGLPREQFLAGINDQLDRSRQNDLLLFVHGFNVSFDAALTRAAQLGRDIPFNGAIVAYCWPTQGGVTNYEEDEPINKASVEPFKSFLRELRQGVPADTRIQIVVHSMGNRIVMEALDQLPSPRESAPIENLVLCSPDVGESDFRRWIPGVAQQCQRVTLYANQSDSALIVSKGLHAEPRAGDAQHLIVIPEIETVDCSRIDSSFMGHSYYGSNVDMLTDLFQLLKEGRGANERKHLDRMKSKAGPYWEFAHVAGKMGYVWHFDE